MTFPKAFLGGAFVIQGRSPSDIKVQPDSSFVLPSKMYDTTSHSGQLFFVWSVALSISLGVGSRHPNELTILSLSIIDAARFPPIWSAEAMSLVIGALLSLEEGSEQPAPHAQVPSLNN
ncbi:hypothetical protein ACHAWO_006784 [Cyclotella atomus]|uniref:Uncharacterized protein n=1 Tax=Cyclotella atomus TaxID=382360 RepID=A0ABD3MYV4_9STRA